MQRGSNRLGLSPVLAAALAVALFAGVPRAGAETSEPSTPEAVPLNQLLRLPAGSGARTNVERRGGLTRGEWQARFREARAARERAEREIEQTRAAIEQRVAEEGGSQWRMAAPGMIDVSDANDINRPTGENPLDYKLTQILRRNRAELARADRAFQDLEVEANLASVPPDWRALPDLEAVAEGS